MQEINLAIDYDPLPKQLKFHDSDAYVSAYFGGLGSGKTYAGAMKSLEYMIQYPGSVGWIGANTYKVLKRATMRTFFEICPRNIIEKFNKADMELVLKNGATCYFGSTEKPDNLRGPNLNWFWLDEINSSSKSAYLILLGRLRRGDRPRGWASGTAKGFNWSYEEFVDPRKKKEGRWYVISSSRENKHLPKEYVKMLEESYTGAFARQEIEGEFVGFEGSVYPGFSLSDHVLETFPQEKRVLNAYIGVDFGYTNPAAMVLFTLDSDDRLWIWDEYYQTGVFVEEQIKKIQEWAKSGFNIQMAFCDPSEPGFIQKMRQEGINAVPADNRVKDGILEVSNKLAIRGDKKPGLFILEPACPNIQNEFLNYRYPEPMEGKPVQENPIKIYDHSMDALRYGIMGIKSQGRVGVASRGL